VIPLLQSSDAIGNIKSWHQHTLTRTLCAPCRWTVVAESGSPIPGELDRGRL